jgi:hypothetical protein
VVSWLASVELQLRGSGSEVNINTLGKIATLGEAGCRRVFGSLGLAKSF